MPVMYCFILIVFVPLGSLQFYILSLPFHTVFLHLALRDIHLCLLIVAVTLAQYCKLVSKLCPSPENVDAETNNSVTKSFIIR